MEVISQTRGAEDTPSNTRRPYIYKVRYAEAKDDIFYRGSLERKYIIVKK